MTDSGKGIRLWGGWGTDHPEKRRGVVFLAVTAVFGLAWVFGGLFPRMTGVPLGATLGCLVDMTLVRFWPQLFGYAPEDLVRRWLFLGFGLVFAGVAVLTLLLHVFAGFNDAARG